MDTPLVLKRLGKYLPRNPVLGVTETLVQGSAALDKSYPCGLVTL
jgi:hypothetical protein